VKRKKSETLPVDEGGGVWSRKVKVRRERRVGLTGGLVRVTSGRRKKEGQCFYLILKKRKKKKKSA